jgi:pimeloyl-[acyl-carrier protein] synthase
MTIEAVPSRFFAPELLVNPYPVYHRFRAADPVHWDEQTRSWIVTRYDDVAAGLRDSRLSSTRVEFMRRLHARPELDEYFDSLSRSMIHNDPPTHTRLRGLVNKAFTPRVVEAMTEPIQHLVDCFLDAVQSQGRMDVVRALAYPLPVSVIARMLGVPTEDMERFKKWSDENATAAGGTPTAEEMQTASRSQRELQAYFRDIIARRKGQQTNDLLNALVQAEEAGDRLSEAELLSNAVLLLVAGNETTTNLIGNGLKALLEHPEQLRQLQDQPARIDSAVEELLRFDGPVQFTTRIARDPFTLRDKDIRAGDRIFLVIGAANHDPERFVEPDKLDVARQDNHHVAFGAGPHFCVGAPLARLEARIVFATLIKRFPRMHLEGGPLKYRDNFNLRGLKELPVKF